MEIKKVKLDDIKPYDKNPRKNDDAVDAVAASIREFGWQQPIVVDREGVIIAGHTRYKAAKKLGVDEVPVVVAENLTEEQVKAYRLADNKTGDYSQWDNVLLLKELEELEKIGEELGEELFTGFEKYDLPETEIGGVEYEAGKEDGVANKLSGDDAEAMYEVTFRSEDAGKIDRIQAAWEAMVDG